MSLRRNLTILLFISRFYGDSSPDEDTVIIAFINKVKWSAYSYSFQPCPRLSIFSSPYCLSDLEKYPMFLGILNFSNVPPKCVKIMENVTVHWYT
jgi:hypothetical protein